MSKIYIAGAHSRGTTMGYYLTYLDSSTEIVAYLYNNEEENPAEVNGIPVFKINENSVLDTSCPVYIGTRGANFPHIMDTLTKCGMNQIIPVDVKLDLDIRNQYLRKYYASVGREYLKVDELKVPDNWKADEHLSARIYAASSAFDKPLQQPYELAPYEKLLQVGAALTDKKLDTDCFDNVGDNISERNTQFCELTGLYWIWKHAAEDVVGLCHYRRHFTVPEDWLERMEANDIDIILPLPLYVRPSIEGNFRSRHIPYNWDYMLEYLKGNCADDYMTASNFFKETSLYFPCNMFIMRRGALNELCSWMFPILFAVAEKGGILEDNYQNRYPGFISERLITYFFDKHRDKYKVVYADKNFLP